MQRRCGLATGGLATGSKGVSLPNITANLGDHISLVRGLFDKPYAWMGAGVRRFWISGLTT